VQGQVVEVSYNIQAAVDDKHNLVVATHTINRNDKNALSAIALEAKENLEVETFTVLVDKGYHNGSEIETVKTTTSPPLLPIPTKARATKTAPNPSI
jgi:hypothetical protein